MRRRTAHAPHGLLALPVGADERAVVAAAAERSVALRGLSAFRNGAAPLPPALVLGFGNVAESSVDAGIAAVADLLQPGPPRELVVD